MTFSGCKMARCNSSSVEVVASGSSNNTSYFCSNSFATSFKSFLICKCCGQAFSHFRYLSSVLNCSFRKEPFQSPEILRQNELRSLWDFHHAKLLPYHGREFQHVFTSSPYIGRRIRPKSKVLFYTFHIILI